MRQKEYNPFDDQAAEYDAWFDGEGKLVFDIELKALQSILSDLPRPWLEIGAGSGRFTQALGIDKGIEPSPEMARIAVKRGLNIIQGKGEQQIMEQSSTGSVFLITALCFMDSPLDVLKEANRILIPGGKIVLGLILKDNAWGQLYQKMKEEKHPVYSHANFYACNEVARLTLEAGFMGVRIISSLFQKPGEVIHMEEPLGGYYREAGFVIIVAEKTEKAEDRG